MPQDNNDNNMFFGGYRGLGSTLSYGNQLSCLKSNEFENYNIGENEIFHEYCDTAV
jgi:hypothetical protein